MYKLSLSINEVEYHNKSRQYDLALGKFWVTRCGCLQLCTAVAMGMTITNFWEMICYGVNRYYFEKLVGIREFLEILARDCFNNALSNDTGTPEKNIPPLDEVYEGETVSTCCELHFSVMFLLSHMSEIFPT